MAPTLAKIVPHLWYAEQAEEAARFYVTVFPGSRVDRVTDLPAETPSGPAGSVRIVEFTLAGQPFAAFSAPRGEPFHHAISLLVRCDDQAEIDRVWDALVDGGTPEPCGWLRDRYGVSWQVVPAELADWIADPDRDRARRVAEAMLATTGKLDLASLRAAYEGRAATA